MSRPKFSIIVPSFNQADFLKETFDSFRAQHYDNLEIIVVDGGSSDHTVDVIRANEDIISYWVSEKDRGQTDAINKGLVKCSGEIITWINSDDTLKGGALKEVARLFEDEKVNVVCGKTHVFGAGRDHVVEPSVRKGEQLSDALVRFNFNQQGTFYHRRAIDRMGPPLSQLHFVMDKEWWNRCLLTHRRDEIVTTDTILAGFRIHGASKTGAQSEKFATEYASILFGYGTQLNDRESSSLLKQLYPKCDSLISIQHSIVPEIELYRCMVAGFLLKMFHRIYSKQDFENAQLIKPFVQQHLSKLDEEHKGYALQAFVSNSWILFRIQRKLKHWGMRS